LYTQQVHLLSFLAATQSSDLEISSHMIKRQEIAMDDHNFCSDGHISCPLSGLCIYILWSCEIKISRRDLIKSAFV